MFDSVGDILKDVGEILNYINPFSSKFFLYIAFIPSDGYFNDYVKKYQDLMDTKFGVFKQFSDTIKAFGIAIDSNTTGFKGFKADFTNFGIGEQEVVNGRAIKEYGDKMKFWIGGLLYFFTAAFLFRKLSKFLGEGR